jgi:hypothetical protein
VRFRALLLGQKARAHVRAIRAANSVLARQARMVVTIQRRVRGIAGRVKARLQKEKMAVYRELQSRQPYYYRMKDEYYRSQNMYHRVKVVKIQCMLRCPQARARVYHRRRHLAAMQIQKKVRDRQAIRRAKEQVEHRKVELAYRFGLVAMANMRIVMFFRRKRVERLAMKRVHAKILRWFLQEIVLVRKLRQAKLNFR